MRNLLIVFIGIIILGASGCTPKIDIETEKTKATTAVDQMIQALETEDMNLMAKIMAHDNDMVNFGTDAAERWFGWNALEESLKKQFASFDKTRLIVKDQVIKVNPSGNTAWFSEIVDWDVVADGQPTHIDGSRITGVLEKRNGTWLIVQFHVSVPVSSQAARY